MSTVPASHSTVSDPDIANVANEKGSDLLVAHPDKLSDPTFNCLRMATDADVKCSDPTFK
jgi:hypothetical protein